MIAILIILSSSMPFLNSRGVTFSLTIMNSGGKKRSSLEIEQGTRLDAANTMNVTLLAPCFCRFQPIFLA